MWVNAKNDIGVMWETGWHDTAHTEYEADFLWSRYLNTRWSAFAGLRLTNPPDEEDRLMDSDRPFAEHHHRSEADHPPKREGTVGQEGNPFTGRQGDCTRRESRGELEGERRSVCPPSLMALRLNVARPLVNINSYPRDGTGAAAALCAAGFGVFVKNFTNSS